MKEKNLQKFKDTTINFWLSWWLSQKSPKVLLPLPRTCVMLIIFLFNASTSSISSSSLPAEPANYRCEHFFLMNFPKNGKIWKKIPDKRIVKCKKKVHFHLSLFMQPEKQKGKKTVLRLFFIDDYFNESNKMAFNKFASKAFEDWFRMSKRLRWGRRTSNKRFCKPFSMPRASISEICLKNVDCISENRRLFSFQTFVHATNHQISSKTKYCHWTQQTRRAEKENKTNFCFRFRW